MKHIRTIINKEWAEVFKNKMVLSVVLIMPILFAILPLVMLGATSSTTTLNIRPGRSPAYPGAYQQHLQRHECWGVHTGLFAQPIHALFCDDAVDHPDHDRRL